MRYLIDIDQVYLDSIIKGDKTHEYRLATPKRKAIKVGDDITLVSTSNSKSKLTVKVTGVNIYPDWNSALLDRWENDFKDVYSSLNEVLDAVNKFYRKEDVLTYGIIVYDIKVK